MGSRLSIFVRIWLGRTNAQLELAISDVALEQTDFIVNE